MISYKEFINIDFILNKLRKDGWNVSKFNPNIDLLKEIIKESILIYMKNIDGASLINNNYNIHPEPPDLVE